MGTLPRDRPDVMIIDDHFDVRYVVSAVLEQQGYSVMQIDSCIDALELLHTGVRPRLILLDLGMPELSGWGFASQVSDDVALRDIPIAVITGQPAYRGVPHRTRDAGVFRKPLDFDALLACVKSVTSGGEPWNPPPSGGAAPPVTQRRC